MHRAKEGLSKSFQVVRSGFKFVIQVKKVNHTVTSNRQKERGERQAEVNTIINIEKSAFLQIGACI